MQLLEAEADESCRALILTGTGRAFCSGADLGSGSLADVRPEDIDLGAAMRTHYNVIIQRLRDLPIPVVIAVNGIAAGGGAALALAGDIVIDRKSVV